MTNTWSPKDPSDERDYWFDFKPLGLADDETLSAATVAIEPGQIDLVSPYVDLEKMNDAIADDTWVVVRVEGGTPGKYNIEYLVTTSAGQKLGLTKTLVVKERKA
jgi:hypothetical protein